MQKVKLIAECWCEKSFMKFFRDEIIKEKVDWRMSIEKESGFGNVLNRLDRMGKFAGKDYNCIIGFLDESEQGQKVLRSLERRGYRILASTNSGFSLYIRDIPGIYVILLKETIEGFIAECSGKHYTMVKEICKRKEGSVDRFRDDLRRCRHIQSLLELFTSIGDC